MCAWILEIMYCYDYFCMYMYCYVDYFCMYMCACIRYNIEHGSWELEVIGCKMSYIGTSILSTKPLVYIGPPTTQNLYKLIMPYLTYVYAWVEESLKDITFLIIYLPIN